MNRKKRPNIFLIFILIILLLIIGNSILSGQDKAQTLTLEQLLTKIEKFQVADVSITQHNKEKNLINNVKKHLINNKIN